MALLANKHLDPVVGVDVHLVLIPPAPSPIPIPHPHVGFILDPKEYINAAKAVIGSMAMSFIINQVMEFAAEQPELAEQVISGVNAIKGKLTNVINKIKSDPLVSTALAIKEKKAKVMDALGGNIGKGGSGRPILINGMLRTTVGTKTNHLPGLHFPLGSCFTANDVNPSKDGEAFMGSKTVNANRDPLSFMGLPAISCWMTGMKPPNHNGAHTKRSYLSLPTSVMLPIPIGRSVLVGGPPTLNWVVIMKYLWKSFRGSKMAKWLADKLGLKSGFLRCVILAAEPVNSITGEVVVEQNDFIVEGRFPLVWNRYYHGHNNHCGAIGIGWKTLTDSRLEIIHYDNTIGVILRFPDHETAFDYFPVEEGDEGAVYDWQQGHYLYRQGDELILRNRSQTEYHFLLPHNWAEKISKLPDINEDIELGRYVADPSNTITLKLNCINDLNHNGWQFHYNKSGLLVEFIEFSQDKPTGRTVRCQYQQNSRLISELSLHCAQLNGYPLVRYQYDEQFNLISIFDAADQPYTFDYDNAHRMLRHTDRNGLSFYYEWLSHEDGIARVVHAWGDGGLFDYHFQYDYVNYETAITDSLGNMTLLQYNDRHMPLSRTNALGERWGYRYDSCSRTIEEIDPIGNVTAWHYDDTGNQTTTIQADRSQTSTKYNALKCPVTITDAVGGKWQQHFDECANLLEQITPSGVKRHFYYDEQGQLIKVVEASQQTTQLYYDAFGFIQRLIQPNGDTNEFKHDVLGRLISRTEPNGDVTHYQYDLCHRLIKIILPTGKHIDYRYDAEGNLVRYVDDNYQVTEFSYFGQGRLKSHKTPDGNKIHYQYNSEEQLVGVVNQLGEHWLFKRDAAGRIIEEIDYWGKSRCYHYNAAGHLLQSIDPVGRLLKVTCDKMGRICEKRLENDNNALHLETFHYNKRGQLIHAANPIVTLTRNYNLDGQLSEEIQHQAAITARLAYHYHQGQLQKQTQTVYRSQDKALLLHQQHLYSYDENDRVQQLTIDKFAPICFKYNPLGQLESVQFTPQLHQQFNYHKTHLLANNKIQFADKIQSQIEYYYDDNHNLVSRQDSLFGTDHYVYDPIGQIIAHTNPAGNIERFTYDVTGNRFQISKQNASGRILQHSNGNQWLQNNAGQLIKRRNSKGEQQFKWNGFGRLTTFQSGEDCWYYDYDPLGRRMCKTKRAVNANETETMSEKQTWFIWDGDRLCGEISKQSPPALVLNKDDSYWQAIADDMPEQPVDEPQKPDWQAKTFSYYADSFEPLVMQTYQLNGNLPEEGEIKEVASAILPEPQPASAKLLANDIYYYQNDLNGAPLRLFNTEGNIAWQAHYTIFGATDGKKAYQTEQPLRLQGQYFDDESGLHYNRNRYYDAQCGLFISQDPIGLMGGINPYIFAPNTLMWIDPLGLDDDFLYFLKKSEVIENAAEYQPLKDKNLVDLYNQSQPTTGHPAQRMITIEHEKNVYKVLFRDDRGEKAHPLPYKKFGNMDVEHFNIEVQTEHGNTKYRLHIIPIADDDGKLTKCELHGGVIKKKK